MVSIPLINLQDWVVYMLKDLGAAPESSFYAHYLKGKIQDKLSLWASYLDPLKWRKMYVKKVNIDSAPILQKMNPEGPVSPAPNFVRQSNEDRMQAKQYHEHDIVGLSIRDVSSSLANKLNTLRTHLNWKDHPITVIMQMFREKLVEYIGERTAKIVTSAKFYEADKNDYICSQNKKLLDYCIAEIKGFVTIIHDAVVRFYQLDTKLRQDLRTDEEITNLISSLLLKSPVYTEIH